MMSFWVVPWSGVRVDAVLLGHGHVEREQPRGGGVDRHRRVHLVERDAVEQRVHVALVGDRDADLADLAARQLVVGVVAGLGGQVEGDREAGLALREVLAVERVRLRARSNDPRRCASPTAGRAPAGGARSRRELYGRVAVSRADRRDAPGPGPRDLRLRAGRRDRRPGPGVLRRDAARGPRGREPRALLLTHIHLDHAGATRRALPALPGPAVYVHERGAPHLVDPPSCWRAPARLYGDDMERLWGEVAPVPEEHIRAARRAARRSRASAWPTRPGHASHHVSYLHEDTGDAYVGDMAGVRIPPLRVTRSRPTPPPDIDVEAWLDSLDTIEALEPAARSASRTSAASRRGRAARTRVRAALRESGRARARRRRGGLRRGASSSELAASTDRPTVEASSRRRRRTRLYQGLERYWRKRRRAHDAATRSSSRASAGPAAASAATGA